MNQQPLVVTRDTNTFTLTRIDERALVTLGRNAVQIEEDHIFWMQWHSHRHQPPPLGLPQFFLMMCQRFGDSGTAFDDYKQSFTFPFHMVTRKGETTGDYLVLIEDWKGGLNVRVYRRFGKPRKDRSAWVRPREEEFSSEDFHFLVSYLDGYLSSLEEAYRPLLAKEAPDFLHRVDSTFLLYGYWKGKPFEHQFEDCDEYDRKRAQLMKKFGDWKQKLVADLAWHRVAHSTFTIATVRKELQRCT